MSAEPTFPTFDASAFLWHPGQGCDCGRLDEAAKSELLAEAWAWRIADTMPDSAQGRRDSEADAETLRASMRQALGPYTGLGHAAGAGIGAAIRQGHANVAARRAEKWARVAREACPGLR